VLLLCCDSSAGEEGGRNSAKRGLICASLIFPGFSNHSQAENIFFMDFGGNNTYVTYKKNSSDSQIILRALYVKLSQIVVWQIHVNKSKHGWHLMQTIIYLSIYYYYYYYYIIKAQYNVCLIETPR
jgi:hypothetical protein